MGKGYNHVLNGDDRTCSNSSLSNNQDESDDKLTFQRIRQFRESLQDLDDHVNKEFPKEKQDDINGAIDQLQSQLLSLGNYTFFPSQRKYEELVQNVHHLTNLLEIHYSSLTEENPSKRKLKIAMLNFAQSLSELDSFFSEMFNNKYNASGILSVKFMNMLVDADSIAMKMIHYVQHSYYDTHSFFLNGIMLLLTHIVPPPQALILANYLWAAIITAIVLGMFQNIYLHLTVDDDRDRFSTWICGLQDYAWNHAVKDHKDYQEPAQNTSSDVTSAVPSVLFD